MHLVQQTSNVAKSLSVNDRLTTEIVFFWMRPGMIHSSQLQHILRSHLLSSEGSTCPSRETYSSPRSGESHRTGSMIMMITKSVGRSVFTVAGQVPAGLGG